MRLFFKTSRMHFGLLISAWILSLSQRWIDSWGLLQTTHGISFSFCFLMTCSNLKAFSCLKFRAKQFVKMKPIHNFDDVKKLENCKSILIPPQYKVFFSNRQSNIVFFVPNVKHLGGCPRLVLIEKNCDFYPIPWQKFQKKWGESKKNSHRVPGSGI